MSLKEDTAAYFNLEKLWSDAPLVHDIGEEWDKDFKMI